MPVHSGCRHACWVPHTVLFNVGVCTPWATHARRRSSPQVFAGRWVPRSKPCAQKEDRPTVAVQGGEGLPTEGPARRSDRAGPRGRLQPRRASQGRPHARSPAPPQPLPPPRLARQVRRLRRGVGRPAQGRRLFRGWRGARALRARPPGEGAAHKEGLCRRAPPSARPPAARAEGRRRWGHRRPGHPPRRGSRRHRAWQAPQEAGTAGGQEGSAAGAEAARPGRARGALVSRDVGKLGGQVSAFRPLGNFCLTHTRLCLQLSNLRIEEAGTPACWEGRGVWGLGPAPPPSVWREGGGGGRG